MFDPVDARISVSNKWQKEPQGVGDVGWTVYLSSLSVEQIPALVRCDQLCFVPANEHTYFSCRLQELQLSTCWSRDRYMLVFVCLYFVCCCCFFNSDKMDTRYVDMRIRSDWVSAYPPIFRVALKWQGILQLSHLFFSKFWLV